VGVGGQDFGRGVRVFGVLELAEHDVRLPDEHFGVDLPALVPAGRRALLRLLSVPVTRKTNTTS
jgi:hypothetical protein